MTALSFSPKAEGIFLPDEISRRDILYRTRSFRSAVVYPGIKPDVIESSVWRHGSAHFGAGGRQGDKRHVRTKSGRTRFSRMRPWAISNGTRLRHCIGMHRLREARPDSLLNGSGR